MNASAAGRAELLLALVPLAPSVILAAGLLKNFPAAIHAAWNAPSGTALSTMASALEFRLLGCAALAYVGYALTDASVPLIKAYTIRKGICGRDLGKRGGERIPEALGIVPGTIFVVCLMVSLLWYGSFLPEKLLDLNSALLSICFMLLLGFSDDVLDWPWRYKLLLPTIASLPLLCCYNGPTSVVVPIPLRNLLYHEGEYTPLASFLNTCSPVVVDTQAFGQIVELSWIYWLYMAMLAVFCTNAINIYAGINGLEVGQSYVIACSVILHNLIEISHNSLATEYHLLSIHVTIVFAAVSLGLLKHNWYPASVFVGDTYCYFAGMTLAVVAILGHFSKTLLLFFLPQIFNFLLSLPQLMHLVPCPRHRLPFFLADQGIMTTSTFAFKEQDVRWWMMVANKGDGKAEIVNMTLINAVLHFLGPMHEKRLCVVLLGLQLSGCAFGFFVRYRLAQYVFEH